MTLQILRDLRGLRVEVVHPADTEGVSLVEHLRRIGCIVDTTWPMPDALAPSTDIAFLAIEYDSGERLRRLMRGNDRRAPTLIAIVAYENPSILQLVLEAGAHAVIERPIRQFGLLTQLIVARSLWLRQQDAERRVAKIERKLLGLQKIQRAKSILMASHDLTEEEAYKTLRRQAMSKRVPLEEMAVSIINANDLLNFPRRGV